jgi:filamentous hemagglutinin family protein
MGTTVSQTGTTYNIGGGTIRGTNQFQSFGLFSVGTGDTASFNGPPVISNIIGRVTGGQQSIIDGILKSTITGANLYLLNPYGVLFGKNASLDLSGSFHVSTADYLRFNDGARFHANLSNSSTLTSAPISAFGFLSNTPAAITIQESFLQVPNGKTLSIIGGDISITNQSPGYLYAPCGQINLVSVASPGEVNVTDFSTNSFSKLGNITIFQPSWNAGGIYADGSNYNVDPGGTIIIRGGQIFFENTNLNARGNPGGTLSIKGEQLHLDDTYVNTGTRGAVNHPGTGVDINVTGDVLLTNGSEIASSSVGAGRAGDIRITGGNIQLGDDDPTKSLYKNTGFYGDLGSRAFGSGRGGDVYITADNLTVKNGFFINTAAQSWGDAGNVTVRANSLKLLDEGSISSNGNWVGKGGIVDVIATDVLISGKNDPNVANYTGLTGLAAQTGYWSSGGLLRVTANNLQILDGGSISTTLFSTGPGADIEVTAKNILISGVVIDNRISPPDVHASIDARVIGTYASGTGGNISVVADSLQVTNGGFIASGLFGNAPGNAGNITVKTGSLELSDRGEIAASSVYGTGNAGRLDITAKDIRIIGLQSSSDPFGKDFTGISSATNAGLGGDLQLTTDSLLVADRGSITATSYGSGRGGNIGINAGGVEVLNGSNILSSAFGSGNGGKIEVIADSVSISGVHPEPFIDITGNKSLSPSGIASQAGLMGGSAGNVRITTGTLNVLDGARISTQTFGPGDGGNIEVTANNVLISGVNAALREFLTGKGIDAKEAGRLASAGILAGTNSSLLGDGATGNAGSVSIQAKNLQLSDQGLISTQTTGPGTGGNIELISDQVTLSSSALISASSTALGDAGNIDIDAKYSLLMRNSSITTEAMHADGGNIHIHAGYMVNLIDSVISASVGGGPQTVGGNITIDPEYVILNDSQIIANAYEGKGGNIRIIADVFLASPDSIVDASSALGIDGTVDIRAPITNISGTLAPMQGNFLSTEALLRDRCIARIRGERISSFVVSGRDGLPIRPGSVLPSPIY